MEELTIEQKAKAYEEALERARKELQACGSSDCDAARQIFRFFPELRKSEDERIRKSIIAILDDYIDDDNTIKPEIMNWLKKQGEHANFCNKIQIGDKVTRNEAGILVNISQLNRIAKKRKKQDVQKSADRVKPKFQKEQWIIRNEEGFKKNTYLIKEVKDCYVCEDLKGRRGTYTFNDVNKNFKLWDISDAKDGDVLYSLYSNQPFIYKERKPNEQATAYCGLNMYGKFFVWGTKDCGITLSNCVPATKEQRDALMKAMTDAGYTFDFEKKELKKIIEEVNGEDYGIDGLWHAQTILEKTLGKVDGYQSDDGILEHKAAITAVKKLYEQKLAWSGNDYAYISFAKSAVEDYYDEKNPLRKDLVTWLQSLKQRIGG